MEVSIVCADANGTLLTGKGIVTTLIVRRVADGFLLDWSDLTFKATGWSVVATPFIEVDPVNLPGEYIKTVDVASWDDGFYQFTGRFNDGITILNFSDMTYIQEGHEPEVNEAADVVNAILAADVEGGHTLQAILRVLTAVLAGKASGGGTGTVTFWDHAGTGARLTTDVDVDGNRDVPSVFNGE